MLTGEIRSQIDGIWNAFWTGGISNPMEVIEQITYLLFLRRLDELQEVEELKANRLKKPMERRIFPDGNDAKGKPFEELRWSRFKNAEARAMFDTVAEHVFPWLRTLGGDGSTYARHMKDARFTIPTPQLLAKVVDLIDKVPMEDRDTKTQQLFTATASRKITQGRMKNTHSFSLTRHLPVRLITKAPPRIFWRS